MAKRKAAPKKPEESREVCGIVMPISERMAAALIIGVKCLRFSRRPLMLLGTKGTWSAMPSTLE